MYIFCDKTFLLFSDATWQPAPFCSESIKHDSPGAIYNQFTPAPVPDNHYYTGRVLAVY